MQDSSDIFPTEVHFEGFRKFCFINFNVKVTSYYTVVLGDLGLNACKYFVIKTSCSIEIVPVVGSTFDLYCE